MNTSVLLQFAAETAEAEATGGISEFGLDPVAIALQAGVFVVLYLLFRKFALKNIVKTLDDRHRTIAESLDNAQKIQRDVEATEARQTEILIKARTEADAIIAQAHQESGQLVKEAEGKASARAEKIVQDAKANMDAEIAKARVALKDEVLTLVAQASSVVLREKMDAKKDEELIKHAVEGVSR